jgi:hypothetical protein
MLRISNVPSPSLVSLGWKSSRDSIEPTGLILPFTYRINLIKSYRNIFFNWHVRSSITVCGTSSSLAVIGTFGSKILFLLKSI